MAESLVKEANQAKKSKESTASLVGLKKYCRDYVLRSEPKPRHELKAEIDAFLTNYDQNVEEVNTDFLRKEEKKEAEGIPDEDGWVTVTKGTSRTGQKLQSCKSKKLSKKKELLNFYSYQKNEAKNKQVQELQEKLKLEREKINQMRQMRKFKPY